jgi:hypothetical protein
MRHSTSVLRVAFAFTLALLLFAPRGASAAECGDHDRNGTVAASDALLVLKAAVGGEGALACEQQTIEDVEARLTAIEEILARFSVSEDGTTLVLTGMNLQIVNGTGATDGDAGEGPTVNGLGNLIVGYDEPLEEDGPDEPEDPDDEAGPKSGSHNVVVGARHAYTSFGGIVAGDANAISAPGASVLGGTANAASGENAVVVAGRSNDAEGTNAAVLAGRDNTPAGDEAAIVGGSLNVARGATTSVLGGSENTASGVDSAIAGGTFNRTFGEDSAILSGVSNDAQGFASSVAGGEFNRAFGSRSTVTGGSDNVANGTTAAVTGGSLNTADGFAVVVSGGRACSQSGHSTWRAGSLIEGD